MGSSTPSMKRGPLSFCQELLFLRQAISPEFRPVIARVVRIDGAIDVTAFTRAFSTMVAVHEPLRSRWSWARSIPRTEVMPPGSSEHLQPVLVPVAKSELASAAMGLTQATLSHINCSSGCPVTNTLVRISNSQHYWIFAIHHLAADGWSLKRYGQTFSQAYASPKSLPKPGVIASSISYAKRQRAWFATAEAQRKFEKLLQRVGGMQRQELPLAMASPSALAGQGERREIRLDKSARRSLNKLVQARRCPTTAPFLAALAMAIAKRTGKSQVSVLSNVAGRTLPGALDALGAFYNTVVFSVRVEAGALLEDILDRSASEIIEALEFQEIPISVVNFARRRREEEDIVDKFPITLNVVEHPLSDFRLPGCLVREVDGSSFAISRHDVIEPHTVARTTHDKGIGIVVTLLPEEIKIAAEYSANLLDRQDVAALVGEVASILGQLLNAQPREDRWPRPRRSYLRDVVGDWRSARLVAGAPFPETSRDALG
ncbi:hypothetical protein ACVWXN_006926 [Bradyrhizobium sp. i1.4.4]